MLLPYSMHIMNMDLRSLRHVVVLSKLQSYTRAAQELCRRSLSPAALMLKTMFEKEIGALAKTCRP